MTPELRRRLDWALTVYRNSRVQHEATIHNILVECNDALSSAAGQEWRDISSAPLGDDDFYLVCCNDPADDRSPFVVRGSIFKSARTHPPTHHLSLAYLTHWQPLPAKPLLADMRQEPK